MHNANKAQHQQGHDQHQVSLCTSWACFYASVHVHYLARSSCAREILWTKLRAEKENCSLFCLSLTLLLTASLARYITLGAVSTKSILLLDSLAWFRHLYAGEVGSRVQTNEETEDD